MQPPAAHDAKIMRPVAETLALPMNTNLESQEMNKPESAPSECCGDLRAKFDEWKACAEKSVREEPVKTAGLAFAGGIALTILPVGRVLGGVVRLAVALAKPALFIFGVVKLVEEFDKQKKP